jgi:hypothetical protein
LQAMFRDALAPGELPSFDGRASFDCSSRRGRVERWLAVVATILLAFCGVVGYAGSADMFGDHPRWRGMNRGPADFGLRGETVSFTSQDGIPLKAWWLPADGAPRAAVIIAHGIDTELH